MRCKPGCTCGRHTVTGRKCPPGCTCSRHAGGGKCAPGCTCGRHTANTSTLGNDEITYQALHRRIRKLRGHASGHTCVDCPEPALDWSQVHGTDGTDLEKDFEPRCRSCHVRYDADARLNEESQRRWKAGVEAHWTPERRAARGKQTAGAWTAERKKAHGKRIRELARQRRQARAPAADPGGARLAWRPGRLTGGSARRCNGSWRSCTAPGPWS
jgi:hypothetical protein